MYVIGSSFQLYQKKLCDFWLIELEVGDLARGYFLIRELRLANIGRKFARLVYLAIFSSCILRFVTKF